MFKLAKNKWLITTLLLGIFILSATNALFVSHLHAHDTHKADPSHHSRHQHDPANCAICQNFLFTSGKCYCLPSVTIADQYTVVDVYYYYTEIISVLPSRTFGPRAPPL